MEDDQDCKDTLPESIEEPTPEDKLVEVDILKTNSVQLWSLEKHLSSILLIPCSEPYDRN